MLRRLPRWSTNKGKEIGGKAKLYVRDSGLVHSRRDIKTIEDFEGHDLTGPSWEGFCIEAIINASPSSRHYYFRTNDNEEIDLVVEFGKNERWAIEIKRGKNPSLSAGFYTALASIRATHSFLIHGGSDTFESRGTLKMCMIDAIKSIVDAGLKN